MSGIATAVDRQNRADVRSPSRVIRVLYLFPGEAAGSAMIFAKKQVEAVREAGVVSETFCLESRMDFARGCAESPKGCARPSSPSGRISCMRSTEP